MPFMPNTKIYLVIYWQEVGWWSQINQHENGLLCGSCAVCLSDERLFVWPKPWTRFGFRAGVSRSLNAPCLQCVCVCVQKTLSSHHHNNTLYLYYVHSFLRLLRCYSEGSMGRSRCVCVGWSQNRPTMTKCVADLMASAETTLQRTDPRRRPLDISTDDS